jgi:UNC-50 family
VQVQKPSLPEMILHFWYYWGCGYVVSEFIMDQTFKYLLTFSPVVSSMVFAFFMDLSIFSFFKFLIYTIFIDCLLVGAGIATTMW